MYQDERKESGFWDRIPISWKSISALGLSIGAGVTVGITLVGWISLPDELASTKADVDLNRQRIELLERGQTALIREMRLGNCLTIADKSGRDDWDECVRRYSGADYLGE